MDLESPGFAAASYGDLRSPASGIANLHRIKPFAQDHSFALIVLRKNALSL
jgi:hypothetical protein